MKRFALFALSTLSAACASTGASHTAAPASEVAIARAAPAPLRQQALDLFAAASQPEQGLAIDLDLDAMRARGLLPSDPEIPGGASFVQMLAPFMGELTALKSEWARPLSKMLVYATLIDRAAPFPAIKRLGLHVAGEDLFEMDMSALFAQSVLLIGVEADAFSAKALLENYAALARAARPEVAELIAGFGAEARAPEVAIQGEALCVVEGQQAREPIACLLGGEGVYALGAPAAIAALQARVAAPAAVPSELRFARIAFADGEIGRLAIEVAGSADLLLTIALDAPTVAASQQFAQMANLILARRQQARREFEMATALALQNAQRSIAEDGQAPVQFKEVAAGLTVEAVFDPHGTGLMNPDNESLTQVGTLLTFSARVPAAQLDRNLIAMRNMSALELSFYSGLVGLAVVAAQLSTDSSGAAALDEPDEASQTIEEPVE